MDVERAILVIRRPLECFFSEMNRQLSSPYEYLTFAPIEAFDSQKDLDDLFLNDMFPKWKLFHTRILREYKKPLLIVEYKNLKGNVIKEMTRILNFLGFEMTQDIKQCIQENTVRPFQRPKRPKHEVDELMKRIRKENIDLYDKTYDEIVKSLSNSFSE